MNLRWVERLHLAVAVVTRISFVPLVVFVGAGIALSLEFRPAEFATVFAWGFYAYCAMLYLGVGAMIPLTWNSYLMEGRWRKCAAVAWMVAIPPLIFYFKKRV